MKPMRTPDLSPRRCWPSAPIPTTSSSAAAASIALETRAGRPAHLVVCSRGESATHGTPRANGGGEAGRGAPRGASLEFIELDGDAHLEEKAAHALKLAGVIRRLRPAIVLAPSLVENQHPDHPRLGRLVRDAARLARYGGRGELRALPPHAIEQLFFYALAPEAEPRDVLARPRSTSRPRRFVAAWTAAMEAHASQMKARNYVEMQLAPARVHGLRAGVGHAIAALSQRPARLRLAGAWLGPQREPILTWNPPAP